MIMEQLVNGTPPTAIPGNIRSDAAYLVPFLEVHTPSVTFCRRMRGELRILTETLAALRIAKAANWRQLFTDGTSRRQTALLTAIIAIDGPDGELMPIILRGAFVARGETSEDQVADILEKAVMRGGAKLGRRRTAGRSKQRRGRRRRSARRRASATRTSSGRARSQTSTPASSASASRSCSSTP
jgi:hypothetical protein